MRLKLKTMAVQQQEYFRVAGKSQVTHLTESESYL